MAALSPEAQTAKVKKWIDEKKDPRSAHWQAGLEAVLDLFLPSMENGRLTPVGEMEERDYALFTSALLKVDLSPALYAAFLPAKIANTIAPPETAQEIFRVEKDKPSCKIIILRPGAENRILCAEISDQAHKPGIDIFQSGALLGTYDYATCEECLDGLTKAVRTHAWKKETWTPDQIRTYTVNWFERVQAVYSAEVSVNPEFSFFHSPTLLKMDPIDALFEVISLVLKRQYTAPGFIESNPGLAEPIKAKDVKFCRSLAQTHLLDELNLIKDLSLMDFKAFSDVQAKAFEKEFERTQEKLRAALMHLK